MLHDLHSSKSRDLLPSRAQMAGRDAMESANAVIRKAGSAIDEIGHDTR